MASLPHIAEKDSEILDAQTHIFNFINSGSLKCAVELEIPDIIHKHGQPMTLTHLVNALPINNAKSAQLGRLMRTLTHSGFFVRTKIPGTEGSEGYALTPSATLLLKDNPLSLRPFLLAMLDPIMTDPWHNISEWFQNDEPTTFDTVHGMSLWDYAGKEPKLNHSINDAMACDARLVMNMVVKYCRVVFEGLDSVVDVGGGIGTAAKIIADAFPDLKCTVLCSIFRMLSMAWKGLRIWTMLEWILHDWSDEESVKILKKCKESIPSKEKGGKVIIIDMVVGNKTKDDKSIETQNFFDMLMMVVLTGRERAEKDWAKLFFEAGFSDYKIIPILGLRSLIEVYP
nr:trans-resveratrol di-O-methyltransferase-like isoform X1 [Ipomoea trifida]